MSWRFVATPFAFLQGNLDWMTPSNRQTAERGYIIRAGKVIVCIWPRFTVQPRNPAFAGVEPVTDGHLTYAKAGFAGFSDCTLLPDQQKNSTAICDGGAIR